MRVVSARAIAQAASIAWPGVAQVVARTTGEASSVLIGLPRWACASVAITATRQREETRREEKARRKLDHKTLPCGLNFRLSPF
jgi:hypothetical protein